MRIIFLSMFMSATAFAELPRNDYEHVAASQSNQVLGPVGGQGDIIERLVIVPETTAAGSVTISDGSGLSRTVFVTGTLSDLHTIVVELGARSVSGDWSVSTGANVHVIAVGRFK